MTAPAQSRRLLLPVDGSPHTQAATGYVARYARLLGQGTVIVLHVQSPSAGNAAAEPGQKIVHDVRSILDEAGVPCTVRIEAGEPAQAISHVAAAGQADEIVMGSRGLGQWRGLVIGSVAHKVLQQVDLPVTIVGTDTQAAAPAASPAQDVQRVLLAVDGSRNSLRATDYVCNLKQAGTPIEVELITVVGPIPPGYLQEFITPEKLEFYYQQEGTRALIGAQAALESAGVKYFKKIVTGYVLDKLIDAAVSRNCARIVMGSRGQGPLSGLALGSVAYQAIHLSPVPVTLVK